MSDLASRSLDAVAGGAQVEHEQGIEQPLAAVLPAARVVLTGDADAGLAAAVKAVTAGPRRCVTPTGQSRRTYHPLAVHLCLRAFAMGRASLAEAERDACEARLRDAVARYELGETADDDVAVTLWQTLCVVEAGRLGLAQERAVAAMALADTLLLANEAGGSLHVQSIDDQLDAWTYRELAALHAGANLALVCERDDWRKRVLAAAGFHLQHTQPDYTTYEPWGVFAFLWSSETTIFADQQLHDTAANLQLSHGSAALMAGLLLADAARSLTEAMAGQQSKESR